jgi:hypothetical protein
MSGRSGRNGGLRFDTPIVKGQLSTRSSITVIVLLYVAAWGGLLLSSGGVYWDDWVFVDASPSQTLEITRQLGLPWWGYLLLGLMRLGPVGYHVLSFVLFLSIGMSVLAILRRVPLLSPNERTFVAALVVVLPLMAARPALTVQLYVLSYALFFIAWYLLVRARPPGRAAMVSAGVLFAISFSTGSLLVFYVLPLAHLWYQDGYRGGVPLRRMLFRYWPFLVLPVAWYLIKLGLFQPYGAYVGYNQIDVRSLTIPTVQLASIALVLVALYQVSGRLSPPILGVLTALVVGVSLMALAVFPYVVVGHGSPPYEEWRSRDELLMPLGVAVVVLALCRIVGSLLGRSAAQVAGIGALALSVLASAAICASYYVDWQKQQALVDVFRASPALERGSVLIFHDETRDLNIFDRSYRFYEWSGLLRRAFSDSARFGVSDDRADIEGLLTGSFNKYYTLYGQPTYVRGVSVLDVTISPVAGARPWYQSLPYLSDGGGIHIETRSSTVEQALDEAASGK